MEPDRSSQVAARVVAWHNRHPLARRIQPDQVHGIGVVSLPFAVEGPAHVAPVDVPAPPTAPPVAVEPAPVVVPDPAPKHDLAALPEVVIDLPDGDTIALFAEASQETADASAHNDPRPSEARAEPATGAAAEPVPEQWRAAHEPGEPVAEPAAATLPAESPAHEPITPPVEPSNALWTPAAAPSKDPRSTPPPRWWQPRRWWPPGGGPLHALFSEDFIAPLSPRRVAQWAARHGGFARPLGADAPERQVRLDARKLASAAGNKPVAVHLLTAAIGHDDRRIRVLLAPGPGGAIIGPRHWDPRRVGGSTVLAALLLVGGIGSRQGLHDGSGAAPAPLASASASLAAGSTAGLAASAPTPAASAPAAEVLALAASSRVLPASSPAPAAAPAMSPRLAASPALADPSPAAAAPQPAASSPAPEALAHARPAASDAAATTRPLDVEPTLGRIDMPLLVPRLAGSVTRVARRDLADSRPPRAATPAAALPATPAAPPMRAVAAVVRPAAPPAKAYALVMRPTRTRAESSKLVLKMRDTIGSGSPGTRAEVVQAGEQWRATLFPFRAAEDAQRARIALAGRGLKSEMVDF